MNREADGASTRIVAIAERPDLAPLVARWQRDAFGEDGETFDQATNTIVGRVATYGPEQVFVMLVDGEPAGTASLTWSDLYEEPTLSPWLASVVVQPRFRGRGYAGRLVRRVEEAARDAGVARLWLYTGWAEAFYERLGWTTARLTSDKGCTVSLMCRDLL
jgi:GNAT superfamily N-acetyltransferase